MATPGPDTNSSPLAATSTAATASDESARSKLPEAALVNATVGAAAASAQLELLEALQAHLPAHVVQEHRTRIIGTRDKHEQQAFEARVELYDAKQKRTSQDAAVRARANRVLLQRTLGIDDAGIEVDPRVEREWINRKVQEYDAAMRRRAYHSPWRAIAGLTGISKLPFDDVDPRVEREWINRKVQEYDAEMRRRAHHSPWRAIAGLTGISGFSFDDVDPRVERAWIDRKVDEYVS
jgi:hypothetical protein